MKIREALDELRSQRNALELDLRTMIMKRIDEFYAATGLYVMGVDISFSEHQTMADRYRKHYLDQVSVDIELRE
ncbi:MAG: hypothetical protein NWE89_12340 [Candidatus Bathyarchaeota archaeon]|nr:hypothetical protein [Candidatus Bathyarchaeota archaeon]